MKKNNNRDEQVINIFSLLKQMHGKYKGTPSPYYWTDGKQVTSTPEPGEPVTVTITPEDFTFYKTPNLYVERFWYPPLPSIHEFYAAQLAGISVGEYKSETQRLKRILDKWHSPFRFNWPIGKPLYGFDPARPNSDFAIISAHTNHSKTSALYYLFHTALMSPGSKIEYTFNTEQDAIEVYNKLVAMSKKLPYYLKPIEDSDVPKKPIGLTEYMDIKIINTLYTKPTSIKKPDNRPFWKIASEKGGKKRKKKY